MNNKFLRVKKSENINLRKTSILKDAIKKNRFVYLDFADENNMKIMEDSKPTDNEEIIELIGGNRIGNINQLSAKTYKMLNYLSESKIINDQRKHIDEIVRNRIEKQKLSSNSKENSGEKKSRSRQKRNENMDFRFSYDLPELENYLEDRENEQIYHKLRQGERSLDKSISSVGQYAPEIVRKKKSESFVLPAVKKIRYEKNRA